MFLFLDTGLRVSELASLNVKDIVIHEDLRNTENNEYYVEVLRKGKKKDKKKTRNGQFSIINVIMGFMATLFTILIIISVIMIIVRIITILAGLLKPIYY